MTSFRHGISNVTLEDQLSYKDRLPRGIPYLENNGFLVMGESEEGYDISMASNIFRTGGGREGTWQVEDAFHGQTTFTVVPKTGTGKMHNNEFIANRCWGTDPWPDATIGQTEDAVIWQLGNRQHICRPPYWEIKGEHMGVECDLLLGGLGETAYHKGKYTDFETAGRAGYEHPLWVEGTVTAEGKTYALKNGFGCQERFTQSAFDLAKTLTERPYYWVWWASDNVRIFIYHFPSMGRSYSNVFVDGQEISFADENGNSNMTIDELEWWTDPKTQMTVPVRWHFNMDSPNGIVDMIVSAAFRSFTSFLTQTGATIHYGFHTYSQGRIFFPDGHTVPLNDLMAYVEKGWTAISLASGWTGQAEPCASSVGAARRGSRV